MGRVVSRKAIGTLVEGLKKRHKTIVFTNGCFDIIHPGHVALLRKAKSAGDVLVVGMNSDASVKKIKGPGRPVVGQKARSTVLAALAPIDYVVLFHERTPLSLIKLIKPDVLVKGADWNASDIVGSDMVRANKGRILRIAVKKGFSTTGLITRIAEHFSRKAP